MRLPLCYPIESRDGTLNADSKMKNMVVENVEGELVAVKRPGVAIATDLVSGLPSGVTAQGLAYFNGSVFSMSSDVLYRTVPGGGAVGASWDESIPVVPSYNYAMEIDLWTGTQSNPMSDADWVGDPMGEYPYYNFIDYSSPAEILSYISAKYPQYGPYKFVRETRGFGTEYPNYPWIVGYIQTTNTGVDYEWDINAYGNLPVVIGHTK